MTLRSVDVLVIDNGIYEYTASVPVPTRSLDWEALGRVIFEDGTDIYWARSRVLEYLNFASGRLPRGVTPSRSQSSWRTFGLRSTNDSALRRVP